MLSVPLVASWSSLALYLGLALAQSINVTIQNVAPEIVYTPFVCNASITDVDPSQCYGAWQVVLLPGTPANNATSTYGPSPSAGDIIPQLFLTFRASAFYLHTSSYSNASINITLTSQPSGTALFAQANSSLGVISLPNLPGDETTAMTITYIPSQNPARLDIDSITLTVDNPTVTSSFLPYPSLPPSSSLPTFLLPTTTPSAASGLSSKDKAIAEGVGIGLGLPLLVSAMGLGLFFWQRRRKRRNKMDEKNKGGETRWFR